MATTNWKLDAAHSAITFKVKHMMIANVTGSFQIYDTEVRTEGSDLTSADIRFTADASTINTANADRDNHLKSPDFFDTGKYPQLKFVSTKVEKTDDEQYVVHGNLTIKDITKPVKLDVEFGGIGKDPWGNEKAGYTVSGKIKRTDWGLNWNAALEAGGVLVSEEVKIHAEVQLIKAA